MKSLYLYLLGSLFLLSCATQKLPQDPIPNHVSFKIESTEVGETRVINVWTPPSYENGNDSYPVLYMPDGGIGEDFPHIANTIAELVSDKSIPPIILVGIENTIRRRDLTGASEVIDNEKYCPLTDGSTNFRNFITKELFTEINKRYRTTTEKGIIGESLAGLFVIETLMLEPASFDFYIAMDPSLWWNNHYLVRNATSYLEKLPTKKTRLWFTGSSAEDISTYTNELAETLRQNTPKGLTWKYLDQPNEQHNTIFRATKKEALKSTMNQ